MKELTLLVIAVILFAINQDFWTAAKYIEKDLSRIATAMETKKCP